MNPAICDLEARVVYFPVRHHSPSGALLLRRLVDEMRPDAILIEGPSDYNERIEELFLAHELPIAIYCFARSKEGARRGAYYPFCSYSPEWQALQCAKDMKIKVAFIDLPWRQMVTATTRMHRYADGELHEDKYVSLLCKQFGVDDFNALWDRIIESDRELQVEEYFARCHNLCYNMRYSRSEIEGEDNAREIFMAQQIRDWMQAVPGRILVVTGGFHSHRVMELVNEPALGAGAAALPDSPVDGADATEAQGSDADDDDDVSDDGVVEGIALTPYSYERLDALTGYDSGMPGPGFYHQVFEDRNWQGSSQTYRQLLFKAVESLRGQKQVVSSADLVALENAAINLARLRGQKEVWRLDLIDAIMATLVKDALIYDNGHPMLDAIHAVFRGTQRGRLADEAPLPPLVGDIRAQMEKHHLVITRTERELALNLARKEELACSRVLHQLMGLKIAGMRLVSAAELAGDDDGYVSEKWSLLWSPDFDATCVEASIYGVTLKDAAAAMLSEKARFGQLDSSQAAALLTDACLMGLSDISSLLNERLRMLIGNETEFTVAAQAVQQLLHLYYYDQVLELKPAEKIAALLTRAFERSLWLLETLGRVTEDVDLVVNAIRILLECLERCEQSLKLDRTDFVEVFRRARIDKDQAPQVRGAVAGTLWTLGEAGEEQIVEDLLFFSEPTGLGDFLNGLFKLAREAVQRRPALIQQIDAVLMAYEDEEFLAAAPAMRLAFSSFTPREKHQIAANLLRALGEAISEPIADVEVDVALLARSVSLESRMKHTIKKYGLRGLRGNDD